ncbi:MAG TPA: hypothetical protein VJK02_17475 [Anaerolineales bacterium]|nr:hypothetical protein [Anaerolineales bacterium]
MGTLGIATLGTAVDLKGLAKGMAQGEAQTKRLVGGLDVSVSKMGLVAAGAVTAVAAAVAKMVDETVQYGQAVTDLSRATEMSAEDSSRLIQAADDAFVSQESLTTALKVAVRQGFLPTIENVKILADQYNALSDPMARNALLIKTFGRNGLEMGKLLEMGSEGIKKAADESDRLGLTLTGQNLKDIKAYKESVDLLNDTMNGLWTTISFKVIQAINDLSGASKRGAYYQELMRNAVEGHTLAWQIFHNLKISQEADQRAGALAAESDRLQGQADAYAALAADLGAAGDEASDSIPELLSFNEAVKKIGETHIGVDFSLPDPTETFAKLQGFVDDTVSGHAAGGRLSAMIELAVSSGALPPETGAELQRQVGLTDLALQFKAEDIDATALTETLKTTYGMSAADAAAWIKTVQGETTASLQEQIDNLGVKIVQTVQSATPQIKAMMNPITAAANLFDKTYRNRNITVNIHEITTRTVIYDSPGRQHGGPVRAGMRYIVGEAGPEAFIPEGNGRIVDARQTQSMVNSNNRGGSVNIEQQIINNGLDDRAALLQIKRLAGL